VSRVTSLAWESRVLCWNPEPERRVGLEIIVGVAAGVVLAAVLITRLAKRGR
jgi:hypothetical protein